MSAGFVLDTLPEPHLSNHRDVVRHATLGYAEKVGSRFNSLKQVTISNSPSST